MVIQYFGEGCFRLTSGEKSLLVDPTNNRLKAEVVLKTLTLANTVAADPKEIIFPGEYEMSGIEIRGFGIEKESSDKFIKTVYTARFEEMNFLFLGHISKTIDPDLLEEFGEPDVIFTPVGGEHFLSDAEAVKLVKHLEPAVVIPSFAKDPAGFLKAIGHKGEILERLTFKKKDLADHRIRAVVLKAST